MRPVRMTTFVVQVYVLDGEEKPNKKTMIGEFVTKSDVHYCAEKAAIDALNENFKNQVVQEYGYCIYAVSKSNPKSWTLVEKIYPSIETGQIVIE